MATTLLSSGKGFSSTNTAVSNAIDTTGASLLVAVVGSGIGLVTLSDNQSNTWVPGTVSIGTFAQSQIFYCFPAVLSASHTFTATTTGLQPSICVGAFVGTDSASSYDQHNESGIVGPTQNFQTGSVTPSVNNELIVAVGMDASTPTIASIDLSFIIAENQTDISAYVTAMAYLIQGGAAAVNPTWALIASGYPTASIATFTVGPAAVASNGNFFFFF